jgi:hypothetical protein
VLFFRTMSPFLGLMLMYIGNLVQKNISIRIGHDWCLVVNFFLYLKFIIQPWIAIRVNRLAVEYSNFHKEDARKFPRVLNQLLFLERSPTSIFKPVRAFDEERVQKSIRLLQLLLKYRPNGSIDSFYFLARRTPYMICNKERKLLPQKQLQ